MFLEKQEQEQLSQGKAPLLKYRGMKEQYKNVFLMTLFPLLKSYITFKTTKDRRILA